MWVLQVTFRDTEIPHNFYGEIICSVCSQFASHSLLRLDAEIYIYPLLISTVFLKYPLELKKISVRTEKKIQLELKKKSVSL